MSTTPNMGLTKWDLLSDTYDHSQLSTNFDALDRHDHTTGKGVQIKRNGFASYDPAFPSTTGIHNDQLAPDAVTTDKIANGTIQASDIDSSVFRTIVPLGTVIAWYRSDPSVPLPSSYALCDGTAWSAIPNQMGPNLAQQTTGQIPDLRNKFVLGADPASSGSVGPSQSPSIGQAGGSHTQNLSHTHTANAHSHNVNAHIHGTNPHYHTVDSHTHLMSEHRHMQMSPIATFGSQVSETVYFAVINPNDSYMFTDESTRSYGGFDPGFSGPTLYDVYNSATTGLLPTDALTNQMYGISAPINRWAMISSAPVSAYGTALPDTGAAAPNTNTAAPDTLAATSTTDSQTVTMGNSLSSTQDVRPGFVGLVYLMKVTY